MRLGQPAREEVGLVTLCDGQPVRTTNPPSPLPHPMPFSRVEKGISSLLSPLGREVGSEGSRDQRVRGCRRPDDGALRYDPVPDPCHFTERPMPFYELNELEKKKSKVNSRIESGSVPGE